MFEIVREDFGRQYTAALKVITIPQNESEIKSVMADGMDSQSVTSYYRGFVEEIVSEFALMSKLKGNSNIVSYEDHKVIEHQNKIGWDILIRMELLTPLLDHIAAHSMTTSDVVQLGIDMCRALEFCQKNNIIHRDIKPENIFVSKNGDYKLGDFGIARTIEKTTSGLSKKGTYSYMAPEVYRGEPYGASVDLYSLGLVLFRLLNDNRAPFLPLYPAPITYSDREAALSARINGAELPKPVHADEQIYAIIKKACAFRAKDRYASPSEMRMALEAALRNQSGTPPVPSDSAPSVQPVHESYDERTMAPPSASEVFRRSAAYAPAANAYTNTPSVDSMDRTECISSSCTTENTAGTEAETAGQAESVFSPCANQADKPSFAHRLFAEKGKRGISKIALGGIAVLVAAVLGIAFFSGKDSGKTPSGLSAIPNAGSGETAVNEPEVEKISVGKTFDSLLWGNYTINDFQVDENGKISYEQDLTDFMDGMKYETMLLNDIWVWRRSILPAGSSTRPQKFCRKV